MKNRTRHPLIVISIILLVACASGSYIQVDYRMPEGADILSGRQVVLSVQDTRLDKTIFDPKAAQEFKRFTGIFSLYLVGQDGSRIMGTYDVPSLFKAAFEKRLTSLGVTVVSKQTAGVPVFDIDLKKFDVELQKRSWASNILPKHTWVSSISYDVDMVVNGKVAASEQVVGNAERDKVLGKGQAETVISEIFTDSINKLDIVNLFKQAEKRS